MPRILEGLAGAGQGVQGAQEYLARKQALEAGKLNNAMRQVQLDDATAESKRQEGYRQAMSESIGLIGKLQEQSALENDPLAGIETPDGAMLGAGRTLAEIQQWAKGRDDQTVQALSQLRERATRVAQTDPDGALALLDFGGNQIRQRVAKVASEKFNQRASRQISAISQLVQEGRVDEGTAQQFQDSIQSAMEQVEQDPMKMAQAEQVLQTTYKGLDDQLKEQDKQQLALEEIEWMKTRPGGFDAATLKSANRMLSLGIEPDQVATWLRANSNNKWQGGRLSDAPESLKSQWQADAASAAREFVTDKIKPNVGEKGEDYIDRVLEISKKLVPSMLEEVYRKNGVTDAGARYGGAVPPAWLQQAQQKRALAQQQVAANPTGMRAGDYTQAATASMYPSLNAGGQPAQQQGAQPRSKALDSLVQKPPPRKRAEKVDDYVARVQQMVQGRGGSDEDVFAILEAAGITPEMLQAPK